MYVFPFILRLLDPERFSTSWYKPGQTPGSVLGEVFSSLEECRAETVALFCGLSQIRLNCMANRSIFSGWKQRYFEDIWGL